MRSRLQPKERGGEQEAGLRPAPTASPECRMNVTGTVGSVPPGEQGGLGCRLLFKQRMGREGAGAGEEEGEAEERRVQSVRVSGHGVCLSAWVRWMKRDG